MANCVHYFSKQINATTTQCRYCDAKIVVTDISISTK